MGTRLARAPLNCRGRPRVHAWASTLLAAACTSACGSFPVRATPEVTSGKESIYQSLSSGSVKIAEELLNNDWDIGPRSPVAHLPVPLSWTEDPFNDHYWKFIFYSLRPLSNLVFAYYTTHQVEFRDKLVQILESYTDYDSVRLPNPDTFDYRHAAAFRALMLVNCYGKLVRSGDMPADLEPKLRASIVKLGDFLLSPINFEAQDNHAFNEGAGLMAIGANFPDLPSGAVYLQSAIDRLVLEMSSTVGPDGVETENSPFYHFYVLTAVMQDYQWAQKYNEPLPASFGARVGSMLEYATLVPLPDGTLPLVGSTVTFDLRQLDPRIYTEDDVDSVSSLTTDQHFDYIRTGGQSGVEPTERNVSFAASGQGILRSSFGSAAAFNDQTHVTFSTSPWRNEHTHHDTLGINLYSSGHVLLSDSGLDTYIEGAEHDYFWSTRAHNTVVVDGQDRGTDPTAPVTAGLVATAAAPDTWAYQSGAHGLYPGVTHRRSVVLLQKDVVLIVDALSSDSTHDYVQTWHLGPDLQADVEGPDVIGRSAAGEPLILVHQGLTSGLTLTSTYGQNTLMQGYVSLVYETKQPNWALEYKASAQTTQAFLTLLASGAYASGTPQVTGGADGTNAQVTVCAGDAKYDVSITNQASAGEAVTIVPSTSCR
jgi:hypothetical protein